MAQPPRSDTPHPPLNDPERTAANDSGEGVSSRKFLGIPVWATAVLLAALAAVMYLLMLTLL